MKAILLAGGKGTRLRPLTLHTPKPIVPIFDRPFLAYQIDLLKQVPEIDEVILSLNYQPRRLEETFGDGAGLGLRLRYVVEPSPLGTGGAIRYAAQGIDDTIVVFNGDVMTAGGRRRRGPPAPRAPGQGDDRAHAGGEPGGLRAGRDRAPTARCAASSRSRRADEITCDTINAGIYVLEPRHLRPDPQGHAVLDRARLLPVAGRARGDLRRLRRSRLLDRHRHAGEVHRRAPRHLRRPLPARPGRNRLRRAGGRARRQDRGRRGARGPVLRRRRRRRQGRRARSAPTASSAAASSSRKTRRCRARSSGRTPASAATPSSTARSSAAAATSAASARVGPTAILGDKTALTDFTQV